MISQEVDGVRYIPEEGSLTAESYGEKKRLFLDENAKDFCVGEYGDGCGGGRVFILYDSYVKVYDLDNSEPMLLLQDLTQAKNISKHGCNLHIETATKNIRFNLSTMKEE